MAPIQRAEELLATLPGVISARIMATPTGAIEEIHLLTSDEVGAKQTVRNVESALIAHFGMRVSHKKISVATSNEPAATRASRGGAIAGEIGSPGGDNLFRLPAAAPAAAQEPEAEPYRRRLYFEDVEVRRSRVRGIACRVTLRKGDETYVGEAEGLENERLRIELAARATVLAMLQAEGDVHVFALEGCKTVEAFDRTFVFVGVSVRMGREQALLTGSAEVRESPETAAVLATLDATNRWVEFER